jgi:hypothetical protein
MEKNKRYYLILEYLEYLEAPEYGHDTEVSTLVLLEDLGYQIKVKYNIIPGDWRNYDYEISNERTIDFLDILVYINDKFTNKVEGLSI